MVSGEFYGIWISFLLYQSKTWQKVDDTHSDGFIEDNLIKGLLSNRNKGSGGRRKKSVLKLTMVGKYYHHGTEETRKRVNSKNLERTVGEGHTIKVGPLIEFPWPCQTVPKSLGDKYPNHSLIPSPLLISYQCLPNWPLPIEAKR